MPAMGTDALPNPGDVFEGKYRIERLIGKGGMGAVFVAQHELLQKRVAVKVLLGDIVTNQEALRRFQNEAISASKIQGDHVAQVMDVGMSRAGLPFMVMEFLEGGDLSQLLEQRGPLAVEEAVDYVLQALEAIAQAHKERIVHRDLKPANLFVARRPDGSSTVKVLDFGISKQSNPFAATGNHGLTSTKSVLGSPLYMSPEQLRSAKNVDERADIWSLGVILFELLTGRVPFNGESLGELFVAILEQPLPRVSQIRPDVPQGLDDAIQRCLQRPLEQRFANVAELACALAPCAPARALGSVERVMTTLGFQPGSMGAIPVPARGPEPSYAGIAPGLATPSGARQTGPGALAQGTVSQWQRGTGSGAQAVGTPPRSRAPLLVGLAFLLVTLVGGAAVAAYFVKHRGGVAVASSASALVQTADPTASGGPVGAGQTSMPVPNTEIVPLAMSVAPTSTHRAEHKTIVGHTASSGAKPPLSETAKPSASAPVVSHPPPPPATTGAKFDPFATGRK